MKSTELGGSEEPRKKVIWSQWVAVLTSSLILFAVGLGNGWSSPYLAKLSSHDSVDGLPKPSEEELSWVASLMNTGRIFGALGGAIAQDTMGRKKALHFAALPMTTGWICIIVATSVQWLFAARVLIGFAMGISWTTVTHFVSEMADPEIRGSLIVWNMTTHTIGVFVGNLIGPYISMKVFACISAGFCIAYLVLFAFIPETPYRHIMLHEMDKAEKSLQWFRRTKDVKKEMQDLEDYISSSKCTWRDRWREFKEPRYQRSFCMILFLDMTLFFGAYNVTISYLEIILTMAKVSITPSTIVTVCGLFAILSSLVATCLVDKFGRRFLLIASCLGMALSQSSLGIHFKLLDFEFDATTLTWLPAVSLVSYIIFFSAGVGCIPSTLIGELFSPKLKSIASLIFSGLDAIQAAVATGTFVSLMNLMGASYVFWFFAAGMYGSALYFYFFVPETMGRSLQNIQQEEKK